MKKASKRESLAEAFRRIERPVRRTRSVRGEVPTDPTAASRDEFDRAFAQVSRDLAGVLERMPHLATLSRGTVTHRRAFRMALFAAIAAVRQGRSLLVDVAGIAAEESAP